MQHFVAPVYVVILSRRCESCVGGVFVDRGVEKGDWEEV